MKKYAPHIGYGDILDRCAQKGCPICRLGQEAVNTLLKMTLYECVTDPDIREQLRESFGYCRIHAWSLPKLEKGNILGIAIIYEDLLKSISKTLPHAARPQSQQSFVQKLLTCVKRPSRQRSFQHPLVCPACALRDESETLALNVMLKALDKDDDQMRTAFQASEGLCLRHLRQALETSQSSEVRNVLLARTHEHMAATQSALQELIRKYDHRFQHEPVGSERDSWKTAMRFIAGEEL